MTPIAAHLLYALAWVSFGLGHSLLARPGVRARLQRRLGGAERLVYNLIAVVHLAAVLAVGRLLLGDAPAFDLPAAVRVAMGALALGGVAIAVVGFRGYHGARFLGLHQLRHGPDDLDSDRDEPLVTAGLHRYVRHPLYTGGMALLWGLAQSPLGLATAVWGSLYFIVGSRFEERALLRRHGESYRAYRRRVPGFIPWKGRAL